MRNCNQCVSRNGYDSRLAAVNCGVPEVSVLGPLLILFHINDLNQIVSINLNKLFNPNLQYLVNWQNAK